MWKVAPSIHDMVTAAMPGPVTGLAIKLQFDRGCRSGWCPVLINGTCLEPCPIARQDPLTAVPVARTDRLTRDINKNINLTRSPKPRVFVPRGRK